MNFIPLFLSAIISLGFFALLILFVSYIFAPVFVILLIMGLVNLWHGKPFLGRFSQIYSSFFSKRNRFTKTQADTHMRPHTTQTPAEKIIDVEYTELP